MASMPSGCLLNEAHSQLCWYTGPLLTGNVPTFVIYTEAQDQMPANGYNWEDRLKNEFSFN